MTFAQFAMACKMYREQHNFREFIFGHSVCKMYLHSLHIQRRFGGLIQLIGHNNNMRWYIVLLYVCTMVILFLHGLLQKIQNCHITAGEWLVYLPDVVLRRSWCHNIDNTFIPRVYPPPILTLYLGVASNQGPLYTFNQSRARMFNTGPYTKLHGKLLVILYNIMWLPITPPF